MNPLGPQGYVFERPPPQLPFRNRPRGELLDLPSLPTRGTASYSYVLRDFTHLDAIKYDSPEFSATNNPDIRFQISAFPQGAPVYSEDIMALFNLWCVRADREELAARCRMWLVDSTGKMVNMQEGYLLYNGHKHNWHRMKYGWIYNISLEYLRENADRLLPNNQLTIYCKVNILDDQATIPPQPSIFAPVHYQKASDDYQSLFESGKFTDIIFKVQGTELKAHKAIIAARSPVFEAMFTSDCVEAHKNLIEIPDIKPAVFRELLSYLYSTKVPNLEKHDEELLVAADKYQLDGLKSICEQSLIQTKINVQDVIALYMYADSHNLAKLKKSCIEFVGKFASQVVGSEGWKMLISSNRHDLIAELFVKTAEKK